MSSAGSQPIEVSLLTGGSDRPYVYGLTGALSSKGAELELIGSDELDDPEIHSRPGTKFLNLRGDQRFDVGFARKMSRIASYYAKLMRYAATAKPRIFHILWNSRFETFDRTLLMLYYKLLRKKIVITAHNVNIATRDGKDSLLNRLTLWIQYHLSDGIFVHTEKMKGQLVEQFGVKESQVTVIPFGINNSVPNTDLTQSEARKQLEVRSTEKAILFFGRIKPYKGLEHLIAAFHRLPRTNEYRLLVVGSFDPFNDPTYNAAIDQAIRDDVREGRALFKMEFVPDKDIEIYFKAADVLVLPYTDIYQSGVLVLGYSFGVPVLVSDVGSLKEHIVEGQTGFSFKPADPADLAKAIDRYFGSHLYKHLDLRRSAIQEFARERYSWDVVADITMDTYARLLRANVTTPLPDGQTSNVPS